MVIGDFMSSRPHHQQQPSASAEGDGDAPQTQGENKTLLATAGAALVRSSLMVRVLLSFVNAPSQPLPSQSLGRYASPIRCRWVVRQPRSLCLRSVGMALSF